MALDRLEEIKLGEYWTARRRDTRHRVDGKGDHERESWTRGHSLALDLRSFSFSFP